MKEIHVSVIALHTPEGRVLLHERKGEDETDLPGTWLLVGGKIEPGETPEETIRREVLEELGYELANPELLLVQEFEVNGVACGLRHIFRELHDSSREVVSLEEFNLCWANAEELENIKTIDAVRDVAREIEKTIRSALS